MTKELLRYNVFVVMASFAALAVVAIGSRVVSHSDSGFQVIKDIVPLAIAIGAAYLAYCFQRRQAFLVSLRDLWKEFIEAKAELVEYTHNSEPDQMAFGKAHRTLSKAIDAVRGVYRNVGETDEAVGLYPFEPLHDMRRALQQLGWVESTPEKRTEARRRVIQAWNALRWAFLQEFSTPEPRHPITRRDAADPRRMTSTISAQAELTS